MKIGSYDEILNCVKLDVYNFKRKALVVTNGISTEYLRQMLGVLLASDDRHMNRWRWGLMQRMEKNALENRAVQRLKSVGDSVHFVEELPNSIDDGFEVYLVDRQMNQYVKIFKEIRNDSDSFCSAVELFNYRFQHFSLHRKTSDIMPFDGEEIFDELFQKPRLLMFCLPIDVEDGRSFWELVMEYVRYLQSLRPEDKRAERFFDSAMEITDADFYPFKLKLYAVAYKYSLFKSIGFSEETDAAIHPESVEKYGLRVDDFRSAFSHLM